MTKEEQERIQELITSGQKQLNEVAKLFNCSGALKDIRMIIRALQVHLDYTEIE